MGRSRINLLRPSLGRRMTWLLVGALLAATALQAGCGSSSSSSTSDQAALEQARKEGAQQARQQARIKALEKEVRDQKQADSTTTSGVPSAAGPTTTVPSSSVVSPYISTYVPYSPTRVGLRGLRGRGSQRGRLVRSE